MNTKQIVTSVVLIGVLVVGAVFLSKSLNIGGKNQSAAVINSETPKCVVSGCSGELCVEEGSEQGISNCIYNPAFACYKNAMCERQTTGACGWTATRESEACFKAQIDALPNK